MVNPEIIQNKFELLHIYLNYLRELRETELGLFQNDMKIFGSTERFLQLSIEILTDIGNHIIATEDLGEVHWNHDIPKIFHEKQIINLQQKNIWTKMIQFRNLLVHEYAKINRVEVYNILKNHLEDIYDLQQTIASKFL